MSNKMKKILVMLTTLPILIGMLMVFLPGTIFGEIDPFPDWDRSSLEFIDDGGNCDGIFSIVKNGEDSEAMEDTTEWKLYWIASGNPKDGTVIASGNIPALQPGVTYQINYDPADNPNGASGNYMFWASQRPGHPGTGELWSEEIELSGCDEPQDTTGCITINKETTGVLPGSGIITFGFTVYDSSEGGNVVATQDISIDFSTDTTGSETICDEDFEPGTSYWVEETNDTGWINTTPGRQEVIAVISGDTPNSVTFVNDPDEENGNGNGNGTPPDNGGGNGDITTTATTVVPETTAATGEIEVLGIQEELPMTGTNNMMLMILGLTLIAIGGVFGSIYLNKTIKRN